MIKVMVGYRLPECTIDDVASVVKSLPSTLPRKVREEASMLAGEYGIGSMVLDWPAKDGVKTTNAISQQEEEIRPKLLVGNLMGLDAGNGVFGVEVIGPMTDFHIDQEPDLYYFASPVLSLLLGVREQITNVLPNAEVFIFDE